MTDWHFEISCPFLISRSNIVCFLKYCKYQRFPIFLCWRLCPSWRTALILSPFQVKPWRSLSAERLTSPLASVTLYSPPKLVTKQACASGMSIRMPHQSFAWICKPGRRPPKFSPPFCCLTEPAQRLICSAVLSWAELAGVGCLNRESRRASAHPVKPFNWVSGEKAQRLFQPPDPQEGQRLNSGYARPSTKGGKGRSKEGEEEVWD